MSAGYEIPISVSAASSFSVPQSIATPTIFNFGSGDVDGGHFSNEQDPVQPVTATASAALGGDSNAASSTPISMGAGINPNTILIAGAVVVSLVIAVAAIYLIKHK